MPLVSNSLKTLLSFSAVLTMNGAISFAAAQDAPTPQDAAAVTAKADNVEIANVQLANIAAANTEVASADETAGQPDVALEVDAVSETESDIAAVPRADYSMMNLFMGKLSANERGRPSIAYELVRENALPVLDEYEEVLTAIDINGMSDDERLAYWLNVQNFLVVKAVATDTKKSNLKSLRGTAKKPGKLWTKDRITLGGESYSIADVEAKITSDFKDPNVIYGMYQGVKGGPCLSETAYEGATVRARLAELGGRYVNSRGIVSPSKGVVTVTPVYEWNKTALFNGDDKEILKHVKTHANTALRGRLNTGREIKFTKLNYVVDNYIVQADARSGKRRKRKASSGRRPPQPQGSSGSSGGGFGS